MTLFVRYEFMVSPKGFLIHLPHEKTLSTALDIRLWVLKRMPVRTRHDVGFQGVFVMGRGSITSLSIHCFTIKKHRLKNICLSSKFHERQQCNFTVPNPSVRGVV